MVNKTSSVLGSAKVGVATFGVEVSSYVNETARPSPKGMRAEVTTKVPL